MEFQPAVYEHAAKLIGKTPWEASRDGELMFQAHAASYRRYRHRPVVVGIDIYNLEVEAYGSTIAQPGGCGIPAVTKHICASADDVLAMRHFDPASAGRIPMIIDVANSLAEEFPDAQVLVPLSGPFSIASCLMGFETLLCETLTNTGQTIAALEHLVDGQLLFASEIRRRGADMTFFESAAAPPMMSPDQFARIELPPLKRMLQEVAAIAGHPMPCIIGGNTAPILEAILSTGTGYVICPSETDQAAFMRTMATHPQVVVRINMNPDTIVRGPWEAIRREVDRIVALAGDRPNVCMGSGVLPYEAPPEHIDWIRDYLRSSLGPR